MITRQELPKVLKEMKANEVIVGCFSCSWDGVVKSSFVCPECNIEQVINSRSIIEVTEELIELAEKDL